MNQDKTEILHKEIDLIQACISRISQNSFFIKGWAISIVAVVLALSKESVFSIQVGFILLLVLVAFWRLDAYFLRLERLYRKLYENIIENRRRDNWDNLYDLNPHRFKEAVGSQWTIMFSATLRVFYGIPIAAIIGWLFLNFIHIYGCL